MRKLISLLFLVAGITSCESISHVFYNPNQDCTSGEQYNGKQKKKDFETKSYRDGKKYDLPPNF